MTRPLLVLGTTNRKKGQELAELLSDLPLDLKTLGDFPEAPQVLEDGQTFADNAAKKASELARALKSWVLGEDSGICVDALGGRPGVYSARYAGPAAGDEANNRKLLAELRETPDENRTASYVCTMAVSDPSGQIRAEAEGRCHGLITREPRGSGGFGYDPLFLLREYHHTFAELPPIVKAHLSHRARAVYRLRPQLMQLFPA